MSEALRWRDVLLGEMAHTDDVQLAKALYGLVKHAPVGREALWPEVPKRLALAVFIGVLHLPLVLIGARGQVTWVPFALLGVMAVAYYVIGPFLGRWDTVEARVQYAVMREQVEMRAGLITFWLMVLGGLVLVASGRTLPTTVTALFFVATHGLAHLSLLGKDWANAIDQDSADFLRYAACFGQPMPLLTELEEVLRQRVRLNAPGANAWAHLIDRLDDANAAADLSVLPALLKKSWKNRLYTMLALRRFGCVGLDGLMAVYDKWGNKPERSLVRRLIKEIAEENCSTFWENRLAMCLACFRKPVETTFQLSINDQETLERVSYFCCPACGKSKALERTPQGIVALLDSGITEPYVLQDGMLTVNWLQQGAPFDFDRVEIRQATDYDIEHLCIEVGNDTDAGRVQKYRTMPVVVAAGAILAENTEEMLRRTFGKVERLVEGATA